MRWISTFLALALGAALAFSLVPSSPQGSTAPDFDGQTVAEADPVAMSFERDMSREPGPTAPVRRDSIDHDELYETINTIRWTTEEYQAAPSAEATTEKTDDE